MKNVIIMSLIILSFFSCVKESRMFQRQYLLFNGTQNTVKINTYRASYPNQIIDVLVLNENQIYEGERVEVERLSNDSEGIGPSINFKGDSLIVIFNNERKSVVQIDFFGNFSEPTGRNIFRHGSYVNIGNDQFQFTFTEEDYENAEDCGGPCE